MSEAVLDSSAALAWLWGEPGGSRLDQLAKAHISAVNLAEVAAKLQEEAVSERDIGTALGRLPAAPQPFDAGDALQVGLWRGATRHKGLSLGDRACLALGKRLGLPVYTTDRAWAELDLGVEVVLIR
jgi:ribonuclease VapC